ncbi:MAG: response regulator [Patescibacteria group bacterium]|nr:response regulator [Patescibacteria group bacterium]
MPTKKVLLVEDDPFLSQLLMTRMQRAGLEVGRVADGEEAINFLKSNKPDLILLDLILPKKSGFQVLEEMRSDPLIQESPVIIISNLSQESDVARGKELGAIEYYVKARTSIDDLVARIATLLADSIAKSG